MPGLCAGDGGSAMRGDFDEDEDPDFEPDECDFDCHMDRDGSCGKAGSEECDFECPYQWPDEDE
jgi:hypothetical protein